jgi:HlyD family secretion protein
MKVRRMAVLAVVVVVGIAAWLLTQRNGGYTQLSGTIEADDARIASRVGGRVVEWRAREGDEVTNGQVLVRLEAPEVTAQRAAAAAQLAELEAGPRAETIAAARATWEALQAEAEYARREARRSEELARSKTISATEQDSARARALSLDQQVAAAGQRHSELAAGTRPEQIEQARARLREIDTLVAELEVRSPGACTLETQHVKPGDTVGPRAPLATLVFRGPSWVRVYVPEPRLGHVVVGQEALVKVDAYPGVRFTGTVQQVNRQAEFTPRNVQTEEERVKQVFGVKISLADDPRLRPGMAADVRFPKND